MSQISDHQGCERLLTLRILKFEITSNAKYETPKANYLSYYVDAALTAVF